MSTSGERPAAIAKPSSPVLGFISLHQYFSPEGEPIQDEVEITIGICEKARGDGVAREAMKTVMEALRNNPRVSRLIARVQPCNKASLGLVKSLGFTNVGDRLTHWHEDIDRVFVLNLQP